MDQRQQRRKNNQLRPDGPADCATPAGANAGALAPLTGVVIPARGNTEPGTARTSTNLLPLHSLPIRFPPIGRLLRLHQVSEPNRTQPLENHRTRWFDRCELFRGLHWWSHCGIHESAPSEWGPGESKLNLVRPTAMVVTTTSATMLATGVGKQDRNSTGIWLENLVRTMHSSLSSLRPTASSHNTSASWLIVMLAGWRA